MGQLSRVKSRYINASLQGCCYSAVLLHLVLVPYVHATPTGGTVVGGTGSISQSGTNTTINQTTQNMAIDWQSYNVNANERVQYIQPNVSSISLNRILSNEGSVIAGRIDANGQVILVNPNGMFFTPTATINVGGIIASGLDIKPSDFMNGNYIFNEVLGSDGGVINSGIINAATGGNVALIGRHVENNGLISANLGTVNLAAGKEAVLTFDNNGLLGVRVSKEILQSDLGVDPAVLNNGTIQAEGGKVLLTASVSKDVFSQAVNTNGLQTATSVVVNADGTYTLGGGADVVNNGTIDTSTTTAAKDVGRIVLLGNNVTSSGTLKADAIDGNGGEIELHSSNMTLLTQNSVTSTRSESNGNGGIVKVLGDKVGLFDQSTVDVSGANGGGQALIGGDYQGKNANLHNATATIIDRDAKIYADGLNNGNGGKVIVWADGSTQFLGNIFVRGGAVAGNGGFIETSGKETLFFDGITDRTATNGTTGLLLLDPKNIIVADTTQPSTTNIDSALRFVRFNEPTDTTAGTITTAALQTELGNGSVTLQANNNITFANSVDVSSQASALTNNLTLQAGNSIYFNNNVSIKLNQGSFSATINDGGARTGTTSGGTLYRDNGAAVFSMATGSSIATGGGTISIGTGNFSQTGATVGNITVEQLNTAGAQGVNVSGDITITNNTGDITLNNNIQAQGRNQSTSNNGGVGGNISISATNGLVTLDAAASISSNGGAGFGTTAGGTNRNGGSAGDITFKGRNVSISGAITANGGNIGSGGSGGTYGSGGAIAFVAGQNFTLTNSVKSVRATGATNGSDGVITIDGGNGTGTGANGIAVGANIFNINTGAAFFGTSATINGNGGGDTFNINSMFDGGAGALTSLTVNGAAGSTDTLAGPNAIAGVTNIWNITSSGSGALSQTGTGASGNTVNFTSMSDLTGGSGNDTFTVNSNNVAGPVTIANIATGSGTNIVNVNANGRVTSTITTGTNTNTVNIDGVVGNVDGASNNGTNNINVRAGGSVTGAIAGGSGVDTVDVAGTVGGNIAAGNGDNVITINGAVSGGITTGTGADQFHLAGTVGGVIAGGAGTDTLDITDTTNLKTVQLGATYNNAANYTVNQVETITANAGTPTPLANRIIGASGAAYTWTIDGATTSRVAPSTGANAENTVNFRNFTTLNGGNNGNTFTISSNLPWAINGGSGGNAFNLSSSYTGTITGGAGIDTFTLTATGINVTSLVGLGGNDTLTGADSATTTNRWTIDSTGNLLETVDATNAVTGTVNYSGISTLTGGSGTDNFIVNAGASISTINGAGGADQFTINGTVTTANGDAGNDTYIIGATGTVTGTGANGLNGGTGTNSLTGRDTNTTWTVSGSNSGSLSDTGTYVTSFQSIQNLNGGIGADNYNFTQAASAITGTIDGNSTGGVNTISLAGRNGTNTFNVAATGGDVRVTGAGTANIINNFTNIQDLTGGSGADTFVIGATMGTINGGNGANTYSVSSTGYVATINGGSNSDNITLASAGRAGSVNGDIGTDSLTVTAAGNTWTLNNDTDGVVSSAAGTTNFTGIENFTDGSGTGNTGILDLHLLANIDKSLDSLTGFSTIIGNNDGSVGNTNSSILRGRSNTLNDWQIGTFAAPANLPTGITIDGVNDGTVTYGATTMNFINFSHLVGGTGTATNNFTITGSGAFNGLIEGGGAGNTLTARDVVNTWAIGPTSTLVYTPAATTYTTNFSGIQNLVGAASQRDVVDVNTGGSITSFNAQNGVNEIRVNSGGAITGQLTTGTGNDTVTVNAGGSTGAVSTGDGTDTISISGTVNGVVDAGTGTNDSLTTTYTTVRLGNTFTSNTVLTANNFDSISAAAGSTNTLIGPDTTAAATTFWTVGSPRSGNVADAVTNPTWTTAFSNFDILTGGSGTNNFTINNGGTINTINSPTGNTAITINVGGNVGTINTDLGADTVDIYGTATTVNTGANADVVNMYAGSNAGVTTGTINLGAGADRFTSDNAGNTNTVTHVNGNAGNDQFSIGTVNGSLIIDGGTDTDTLGSTVSGFTMTVFNTNSVAGVSSTNIEGVNAINGTLNAPNSGPELTWNITGENAGQVNETTGTNSMFFSGFVNINGSSGVDHFNFSTNGSMAGLVNGNGGANQVDIALFRPAYGTNLGTYQLNYAGNGSDVIMIHADTGATGTITGTYNPNQSLLVSGTTSIYDQLVLSNGGMPFSVNYRNVNSVTDNLSNTLIVNGNPGTDTLHLNTGSIAVNTATQVNYGNNVANLTVNAMTGNDVVSIDGNVAFSGTLAINGGSITANAANTTDVTAATLVLDSVGIAGSNAQRLRTNVDNLSVIATLANGTAGPVYIDETNTLNINQLSTNNLVDLLVQAGNVSSNTGLVSNAALTVRTPGNISLAGTFNGALTLTGLADTANVGQYLNASVLQINNSAATLLANIQGTDFSVTSGGNISQTTGTQLINTGVTDLTAANNITLTNAANDFSNVSANAGNAIAIQDVNNIAVSTLTSQDIRLTAGGQITNGNANQTATNLTAANITLVAATGVGSGTINTPATINTATANLSVTNQLSGGLFVSNTGPVTVMLQNNGDIYLHNTSDVTVTTINANNGVIPVSSATNFGGTVRIDLASGSVSAVPGTSQYAAPDIVAQNLYGLLPISVPGNFGAPARPISIMVRQDFILDAYQKYVYYYDGVIPARVGGLGSLVEFTGLPGLSGQQLIDIESLAEIDPAIFTQVKNYYYEDVALLMPEDQRYGDEDVKENKKSCDEITDGNKKADCGKPSEVLH